MSAILIEPMGVLQQIPMVRLKVVFVLMCLTPLVWLAWRLIDGDLGASPAEAMNHQMGLIALRLLALNLIWGALLALGLVPVSLRRLTILRRHLGVVTFAYAFFHVVFYVLKEGDVGVAGAQMFTKTYLIIGSLSWLLLLALTVTSADWAVRRMRKNWKRLHRLAYVAMALTIVHFQLIEKKDWRETLPLLIPLLILSGARAFKVLRRPATPARPLRR